MKRQSILKKTFESKLVAQDSKADKNMRLTYMATGES